jgi:DNA-binding ferritin-like protein
MSKISVDVVISAGTIDEEATRASFETALSDMVAERASALGSVADGVADFFAKNPSNTVLPTVSALVAQSIGTSRTDFSKVQKNVEAYIRANADGKGEDLFHIGRGRSNSGVSLK